MAIQKQKLQAYERRLDQQKDDRRTYAGVSDPPHPFKGPQTRSPPFFKLGACEPCVPAYFILASTVSIALFERMPPRASSEKQKSFDRNGVELVLIDCRKQNQKTEKAKKQNKARAKRRQQQVRPTYPLESCNNNKADGRRRLHNSKNDNHRNRHPRNLPTRQPQTRQT